MNIKLKSVIATEADGAQRSIDHVFIRGSQVNFICFPDILAHAPMFDRVAQRKNGVIVERGLGRARQAALDAKGKLLWALKHCLLQRLVPKLLLPG
jgi:hypothetical protein